MTCEETESTVWALVFNQTHTAFCNQQVRQGFIRAIDRSVLEEYFQKSKQENLRVYDRLIPPTISLFTQSYTEQTSVTTKNTYDPQAAYQSYRAGMDELEADTLRKIQLWFRLTAQFRKCAGCCSWHGRALWQFRLILRKFPAMSSAPA